MKKLIYSVFLFLSSTPLAWSQISYDLTLETRIHQDSLLAVDVFIKNTASAPFVLGASNFVFSLNPRLLNLKKGQIKGGEFDNISDASSYLEIGGGFGSDKVVLNIVPNVKGTGLGRTVTSAKSKIGTVIVPIIDKCKPYASKWIKGGAIYAYTKEATGTEITTNASYIDPAPIDLDGGVSKILPTITYQSGKLVSSSLVHNQWYLDGSIVPGANQKEFVPAVAGSYKVEVTHSCGKNLSEVFPVTITSLLDFALSYSFATQPNPFIGESTVSYTLQNPSLVKLQLYDLSGAHLFDLDNGMKGTGKHEFVFKPAAYQVPAGTYVLKLAVGDKMGTVKLVALK